LLDEGVRGDFACAEEKKDERRSGDVLGRLEGEGERGAEERTMSLDPIRSERVEVKLRRLRISDHSDSSFFSSINSSFKLGSSSSRDVPVESRPASGGGRGGMRREGFEGDGLGDSVCERERERRKMSQSR